ncbi:MAG: ATP-binding protein [Proteobacteria bacterium]|nr:ATP-binding protein [Pseudomonadota bacterium]
MKIILANDVKQIPILAEKVEAFLLIEGADSEVIMEVNLSLDELLTNIINYGYPNSGDGDDSHEISIDMVIENDELNVVIIDDGIPFNPLEDVKEPDLSQKPESRQIGGLGIYLARKLTDSITYYRNDGGFNRIILSKCLKPVS